MDIEFKNLGLVEYMQALQHMENHVNAMHEGTQGEQVWLLEHPSVYTAGTSARSQDLLDPQFPVHETGRGGEYTYHGPGQRVAYVMLDLKKRQEQPDIKHYVWSLEEWIIRTLAEFDVQGERREGRVGIWVVMPDGSESKIAAIGVRVRHWITFHGISININPDLSHFSGIVPCGIAQHGVTSVQQFLGSSFDVGALDEALQRQFQSVFNLVKAA